MDIQSLAPYMGEGAVGLIIVLLGMIRLPKIEVNLWTILARAIGRAINGEIIEKVDEINDRLEYHIENTERERAFHSRQRILRFCDEILLETRHSREHYDEILEDVNKYEAYCKAHSDFINNKVDMAIKIIKDSYEDCINNHKFLVYTKSSTK